MDAAAGLTQALAPWRCGMACVPLQAGQPCGDAAGAWPGRASDGSAQLTLALADGLGHGAPAAEAASAALQLLASRASDGLQLLMAGLDQALAATRGAAVGLAQWSGRQLLHAAVGNTRALRWRGSQWLHLPAQPGIVGAGLRTPLQVHTVDLQPGDWWLMFSDGLAERLALPACLPEWTAEPRLLCEHLLQHHRQGEDDAGVLALHLPAAASTEATR